jgi:hypothetical protein
MAEEIVDSLLLVTRFDDAGLEQSQQQTLAKVARFTDAMSEIARRIEPIDVDTSAIGSGSAWTRV